MFQFDKGNFQNYGDNYSTSMGSHFKEQSLDLTLELDSSIRNRILNKAFATLGLGVGNEYFFGLKFSAVLPFSFQKSNGRGLFNSKKRKFYPLGGYVSLDANAFGFFAVWGGVGVNAGLSLGFITIDNSLIFLGGNAGGGAGYGSSRVSYNPKIGLNLGNRVWLKAGPSFSLKSTVPSENWIKIGDFNYNFELSFFL